MAEISKLLIKYDVSFSCLVFPLYRTRGAVRGGVAGGNPGGGGGGGSTSSSATGGRVGNGGGGERCKARSIGVPDEVIPWGEAAREGVRCRDKGVCWREDPEFEGPGLVASCTNRSQFGSSSGLRFVLFECGF